ncbi:MAG: YibE/F family protein [Actinomycetota bacterium]|nr:YibE/F family protein [Actinomycetota bacterium]
MSDVRGPTRWPAVVVAVIAVAVAAAMVLLWPGAGETATQRVASAAERGKVVAVRALRCRAPEARDCRQLDVELLTGPESGLTTQIRVGESLSDSAADVGDEVRVVQNDVPAGVDEALIDRYTINDFERRQPLLWLAIGFVVIVLAVGRVRGARALAGLSASVTVVFAFIVPAILDGRAPAAAAFVGALAIMLVTVVLTHGLGAKSVAAILGTTASLCVTVGLGAMFVQLAHITGLSSDASTLLLAGREDLSLEGIVLAGLVIGALGVLDDVTVSQASTVLALRRANAELSMRQLYRRGLDVGQDHASATVNTLVLAYVGAGLPVLLIFSGSQARFGDAINSEAVAQEVVAMLSGSIGLMTAVPITTAIAALLAVRLRPEALPDGHLHVH